MTEVENQRQQIWFKPIGEVENQQRSVKLKTGVKKSGLSQPVKLKTSVNKSGLSQSVKLKTSFNKSGLSQSVKLKTSFNKSGLSQSVNFKTSVNKSELSQSVKLKTSVNKCRFESVCEEEKPVSLSASNPVLKPRGDYCGRVVRGRSPQRGFARRPLLRWQTRRPISLAGLSTASPEKTMSTKPQVQYNYTTVRVRSLYLFNAVASQLFQSKQV